MSRQPIIAIIGGTIWGNRGAESMLTTTIGLISRSYPDAQFLAFSYYPEKDRELIINDRVTVLSSKPISLISFHFFGAIIGSILRFLKIDIPKGKLFKITRLLAASDVLLDIGGITFSDGREKFLPFNILTIWAAMLLNVPVIKMAQALGPFRNKLNKFVANTFLNKCNFVFARGEQTRAFLADLQFPEGKTSTSADIAFLYEPEFSLSKENDDMVNGLVEKLTKIREESKKVIVLSPSVLLEAHSEEKGLDYLGKYLDIFESFEEKGHHFVVIPNASRFGSMKDHNNDLLTITRMRERLEKKDSNKKNIDWVEYDINTKGIRSILKSANVLVTSRYHAMISGLCLHIPTLVIGWSHKYQETMSYFDLDESAIDYERDDISIIAPIKKMLSNEKSISRKITKHFPKVQKRSRMQFDYINRILE